MSKTDDDQIIAVLTKRPRSDGRVIAAAVKARKISAADARGYRQRLADPGQREATLRLLTASVEGGGLAPGIAPASEPEAYPAGWVPELQAKQRRASAPAAGRRERVQQEPGVQANPALPLAPLPMPVGGGTPPGRASRKRRSRVTLES